MRAGSAAAGSAASSRAAAGSAPSAPGRRPSGLPSRGFAAGFLPGFSQLRCSPGRAAARDKCAAGQTGDEPIELFADRLDPADNEHSERHRQAGDRAEIRIYAPPADRSRPLSGATLAWRIALHAPLLTAVKQAFARLQPPLGHRANRLIVLGSRQRREREIK